MKVKEVILRPLDGKYYETEVAVYFSERGRDHGCVNIRLSGYSREPSQRERERGYYEGERLDHVESEAAHKVALVILRALKMLEGERL